MPDPISWSYAAPYLLTALLGGFAVGSIPFGLLLAKLAGFGDIRKIGSGNIGATNVLRTGRKDLAALTVLLDGAKGAVAVLVAGQWGPDMMLAAGLGALLGHMCPPWLRLRGGKGVATALGVILALNWPVGLATCATWLLVAVLLRYSSLSALLSLAAAPAYAWYLGGDLQLAEFAGVVAVLIWARHHTNIRRLLKGEEPRIGASKKTDGSRES
jgi:glycerol-3-phosphate acyltransferase PlsY